MYIVDKVSHCFQFELGLIYFSKTVTLERSDLDNLINGERGKKLTPPLLSEKAAKEIHNNKMAAKNHQNV